MELTGKVAIVTGGASGIGRALARRFAKEGAAGVAVADLDADGARAVADELGPSALGMGGDVAAEDRVRELIDRTEAAFGPVDLYCANAGVGMGTDMETPDEVWDRAFDVNVRAHIVAVRLLLPGWLERGEGYFLSTASAA